MLAPPAAAAAGDYEPLSTSGGGTVCITFDDGAQSVFDRAYPVMSAAGITATMFVVTDWIGSETAGSGVPRMDVTELHVLQSSGWEIGSHSVSHTDLTTLTPEQATYELVESKDILTDLGFRVDTFAYPYGKHTYQLLEMGAEHYDRQRSIISMAAQFLSEYPNSVSSTGALPDVLNWTSAKSYIDRAVQTDSTVIFLFHQVAEDGRLKSGGASPGYADYTIQDLIDYIVEMRERYGLQTVNYRDLPNSSPDADMYIWDGEGTTALASEAANWRKVSSAGIVTNDVVPTSGSDIVWNGTSSKDCDWDLDISVNSMMFDGLYSGTFTQMAGHDIDIGAGGLHILTNVLLKPSASDTITIAGDARASRDPTLDPGMANIICAGDGSQIIFPHDELLASLTISGNVHYLHKGTVTNRLTIESGGHLILYDLMKVRATTGGEGTSIAGRITGPGTLMLDIRETGATYDITNVESQVLLEQYSGITSPSVTTLNGDSAASLLISNLHTTLPMTVKTSGSLSVASLTLSPRTILMGGDSIITSSAWDSTGGTWVPEQSTVILRDGGSAVLAPGQSFNRLEVASEDGRTASWTMTATGAQAPIVTGLRSGSYLWYLDGVEQGMIEADKSGTITLSYQSTGLHELSVESASMAIAIDSVYQAVGIVAVLAVIGGLITMVGRLKF